MLSAKLSFVRQQSAVEKSVCVKLPQEAKSLSHMIIAEHLLELLKGKISECLPQESHVR
jgi:hypothetical protein